MQIVHHSFMDMYEQSIIIKISETENESQKKFINF